MYKRAKLFVALLAALASSAFSVTALAQSDALAPLLSQVRQFYQLGRYSEALPLAQDYAKRAQILYGAKAPKTLDAQRNLAELYDSQAIAFELHGQAAEAMQARLHGLAVIEQSLGPMSLEAAASVAAIGENYQRQGDLEQAEPYFRRAVAIREKILPATDPDLIASLKQLGELLGSQGRYQEASQFFHRTPPPEAPALGAYRPPGDVAFPGQQLLVFFGTNRAQDINHAGSFGSAMSTEQSLGFAIVDLSYDALTATTRAGGTELLKKSDPRYLMIRTVRTVGADEILSEIRPRIAKSKAFAREAIVFVHGFDVSFDDALRRAAQLEHDLAFDGAVFVYSWPSRGQLSEVDYFADQATSLSTAPNLRAFLQFVVAKSGASVVHLIAHSMGSPVLLAALTDLQSDPNWADLHIGQVILAAPDMDAKQFADAIPRLRNVASGITMYASSSDRALLASQFVNRKQSSRAGFISSAGPTIVDGVDTIDVTEAGTDVFAVNHSAYAESSALIEDIKHLLQGQKPPDRRESTMEKSMSPRGAYWRLTLVPQ